MKNSLTALAEKFAKDQIKIMKKHGSDPQLKDDAYRRFVDVARKRFRGMTKPEKPVKSNEDQASSNSRTLHT